MSATNFPFNPEMDMRGQCGPRTNSNSCNTLTIRCPQYYTWLVVKVAFFPKWSVGSALVVKTGSLDKYDFMAPINFSLLTMSMSKFAAFSGIGNPTILWQ